MPATNSRGGVSGSNLVPGTESLDRLVPPSPGGVAGESLSGGTPTSKADNRVEGGSPGVAPGGVLKTNSAGRSVSISVLSVSAITIIAAANTARSTSNGDPILTLQVVLTTVNQGNSISGSKPVPGTESRARLDPAAPGGTPDEIISGGSPASHADSRVEGGFPGASPGKIQIADNLGGAKSTSLPVSVQAIIQIADNLGYSSLFKFLNDLQPGETLTVDAEELLVELDGVNARQNFRGQYPIIDPGGESLGYIDHESSRSIEIEIKKKDQYL